MQQSSKSLDKWANRTIFIQRLGWGLLFAVVLLGIVVFSYNFWLAVRADVFDLPTYYDLDQTSETYWSDRAERDISYVNEMKISDKRKTSRLRFLVNRQLGIASEFESFYDRNYAILAIAKTLIKHDLDINIDKTLRTLNETYESYSIRARIYISIALLQIRHKNLNGAMSAYYEYKRIVNHADLKLDSVENEESFIGAVTILYLAQNIEELSDLFRIQIEFSRRINSSQRMRAYRIIAVEQARTGNFLPNSFNTLMMIYDPVEISRAVQLIVTYVARPPKIEPIEPQFPIPRSNGPWDTIRSTLVVRNTIDNILRIIIKEIPEIDQQQSVLKRIAGSILMCDPEVYKIFRSAINEMQSLDDAVKISVLKLLDNPVSDKIRAELKMPSRPKKKGKNNGEGIHEIDPARHDWVNDKDALDLQITTIDADTLKSIDIRQYSRILSISAAAYLQVNRAEDAAAVLRKAFTIAMNQPDQAEKTRALITIAELQLNAGAIKDAVNTLNILKEKLNTLVQPQENNKSKNNSNSNTNNYEDLTTNGFNSGQILKLVELQVVGHYFDDAIQTAKYIQSVSSRDSALVLIMKELIRTDQLDIAVKIIDSISNETIQNEWKHRLIIAQMESKAPIQSAYSIMLPEKSLEFIGVTNPASAEGDDNISQCVSQLIRFGFLETALITAKRVSDIKLRSRLFAKVGREYVLIFTSYLRFGERNKVVSERALRNAVIISEIILDNEERIIFMLSVVNAVLANKRYDKDLFTEILEQLFKSIMENADRIEKSNAADREKSEADKNSGDYNADIKKDNGNNELVISSDISNQLWSEIFSMVLLARVNWEELRVDNNNNRNNNNRNNKVMVLWNAELAELSERVIKELRKDKLSLSKGRGLVNVLTSYIRCGRLKEAEELVKSVEDLASSLADKGETILILVELMSIYEAVNDIKSFERIRDNVIETAVSFIPPDVDIRQINAAWRQRDIELDRIMRKLIEFNKCEDVLSKVDNIHEPIIYDRILRVVVYIQLCRGELSEAELTAKKLRLREYRFSALRDVRFIKNISGGDILEEYF